MHGMHQILERQLRRWELEKTMAVAAESTARPEPHEPPPPVEPLVTVSRQHGAGGSTLAARLATRFRYTLLDRNLVDRICASTGTRRRIVESLDEHLKPQVTAWCEALLGNEYVDAGDYMRALVETLSSITALGGAVVVGRGANFVAGPERGFHVRVVAPRPLRIRRIGARDRLGPHDAERAVDAADRERREFVKRHFRRDIDDPEAYDLVLNTAHIAVDTATDVVVKAAMEKFERMRGPEPARA
jgi:cytidylate kinase